MGAERVMVGLEAKVSFFDTQAPAVDALLSVEDGQLSMEVSGRPVGRWPISELSPRLSGEAIVVSAEGEQLVIDAVDSEALTIILRLDDTDVSTPSDSSRTPAGNPPKVQVGSARGRHVARRTSSTEAAPSGSGRNELPADARDEQADDVAIDARVDSLQNEIREREIALSAAKAQLEWVRGLVPRRLPIPLRGEEAGLGVVQGVRLKERRPLPGSDGLQPWVVVDSGNVYVTDRRLVFSGAQEVDFVFDEINKKGASQTGLLLGVSSRSQAHILAGPGERLAVVLTAAEKIAKGIDPTLPFREAIAGLTDEIEQAERRLESFEPASVGPILGQSAGSV